MQWGGGGKRRQQDGLPCLALFHQTQPASNNRAGRGRGRGRRRGLFAKRGSRREEEEDMPKRCWCGHASSVLV